MDANESVDLAAVLCGVLVVVVVWGVGVIDIYRLVCEQEEAELFSNEETSDHSTFYSHGSQTWPINVPDWQEMGYLWDQCLFIFTHRANMNKKWMLKSN